MRAHGNQITLLSGPSQARAALTGSADCRQDRPGDTTTLDALSVRIYLSGEVLVMPPSLVPAHQHDRRCRRAASWLRDLSRPTTSLTC